jgi:hypothetical protein
MIIISIVSIVLELIGKIITPKNRKIKEEKKEL